MKKDLSKLKKQQLGEWIPNTRFKKEQMQKRRSKINVVFNYSSISLTREMEKVLNRGLKFCIQPLKLDLTQILVDYQRFERTMIWHEYWFGREKEENYKTPIFKAKKNNLPKNHNTPKELKTFLGAVKSEIMDPLNRNKVKCNLPPDEFQALKELVTLIKDRKIVIKPCDKGAGIIILDFEEYMRACNAHLNSQQLYGNGESKPFYTKVDESKQDDAKIKLTNLIQEAFDNKIIDENEFLAMNPQDKGPGRFYCTFKVHKKHDEGKAPPERPIVSGSNSITENASLFVEHHIKEIATKHKSYLQDTPDFLRHIQILNKEALPPNAILVTMDVSGLYTNIPQEDGIECVREVLDERSNKKIPTGFLTRLLEIVLRYNIFEFNQELFQQLIGTAMGTRAAPPYANIFLARILDDKILKLALEISESEMSPIKLLKRFLDDIFMIFVGNTKKLHKLLEEINKIHPSIKLTMSHTSLSSENVSSKCECEESDSIPFLDVLCSIKDGKIVTDLYRKESDRNQYLLTSSCHPVECTNNIPFSLAMRIVRICSEPEAREGRFEELKLLLMERDYRPGMIDAAISKARAVPREKALKHVVRKVSDRRPVFVVAYDPRLPSIPAIQHKHWRAMVSTDQYIAEVFPEPPLTAFRRQKNIGEYLIRAKVPPAKSRSKREMKGMTKCNKPCQACPFIMEGKEVKSDKFTWKITQPMNCETENCIYMIECNKEKCKQRYIGETKRSLAKRLSEHKGYISSMFPTKATGIHFNQRGHSVSDVRITILEKMKTSDESYRKERERYLINKFNTYYKGINRMP